MDVAQEHVGSDLPKGVELGLQHHSSPEYRAMQSAFIRWHVTGCFTAAADYQEARTAWELSLMRKGAAA